MRRDARASSAGSSRRQVGRLSFAAACAAVLCLASLALSALPASAAVVTDRPLLFKFNGADTTAGAFENEHSVEVDQSSGDVYVIDEERRVLDKFNAAGLAQDFAATGKSSLGIPAPGNMGYPDVAVDNSTVNPGRIYAVRGEGSGQTVLSAFDPAGNLLWELKPPAAFNDACAAAVDAAGHLWVSDCGDFYHPERLVREFAASGSPPAQIGSFPFTNGAPFSLDLGSTGDAYISNKTSVFKYVGAAYSSTLDPEGRYVAVDQSSAAGHIFTTHQSDGSFYEYEPSGALVGNFGKGVLSDPIGIAYNHALDRVYVTNFSRHSVYAFGPAVTGTVPDVTAEAATEEEVSRVKLPGKVNPQSVPNEYFFEWVQPGFYGENWGKAEPSPPQSLPEDNSEHAVSFDVNHLAGNTTYQARLVGLNTANGLRAVSAPVTFTTLKAAAAPALTIAAPSPLTPTSEEVSGTVNPQEDFSTTWWLETSEDPACASGFSSRPVHKLESEASSPVPVAETMTGLLPSQHYCVRLKATNSFGTTTSETKQFTTAIVPPDQVLTAFAAPRTDTAARLNGRANPEGEVLTYRFEWSEDGGATWQTLPDRTDSSEAREPIVVGEQLENLSPNTTYSYRFSAENPADAGSPLQGAVRTFTTRTSAEASGLTSCPQNAEVRAKQHTEYLPDCRGIELVNQPDKGDQNVHAVSQFMAPDGEKIIWTGNAGIPGGYNGTNSPFLASRGPSGWNSHPVAPQPDQQLGEGNGGAYAVAATPDLSQWILRVATRSAATTYRLREGQSPESLSLHAGETVDVTNDGAHVIAVYEEHGSANGQLLDIGNGEPAEDLSIMPDGTPTECEVEFNDPFSGIPRMISATDASRVYFEARPNGLGGGCEEQAQRGLYVRNREAAGGAGQTTLIDPGSGGTAPAFLRTTPDGKSAYFATMSACRRWEQVNALLSSCETPEPADTNGHGDVYRWDEEAGAAGEATCITCEANPDVQLSFQNGNLIRPHVSEDFSHIYFRSEAALAPGAVPGHNYIYALVGGQVRLVADITGTPEGTDGGLKGAQLSSDGNVLLFKAKPSPRLTADAVAPGVEWEFYRYNYRDASLECVSCLPGGETALAISEQHFKLSSDGSTVAFQTEEALLPSDVNRAADLYEWREGRLALISDGVTEFTEGTAPTLEAVDANGIDIFFTEDSPGLTGFEADGLRNVYDARIGGGFPPPTPSAHCTEDSCQGPLQAAPPLDQPGTSTYSGPGNAEEGRPRRRCARGRVRRHGRCVKAHRKHRHKGRAARAKQGRAK